MRTRQIVPMSLPLFLLFRWSHKPCTPPRPLFLKSVWRYKYMEESSLSLKPPANLKNSQMQTLKIIKKFGLYLIQNIFGRGRSSHHCYLCYVNNINCISFIHTFSAVALLDCVISPFFTGWLTPRPCWHTFVCNIMKFLLCVFMV